MVSSRLFLLVALVLTGPLGACQQPSTSDVSQTETGALRLGSVEAVDTLTRAVAPSGRPLVLDGVRGPVVLRGAAQETATLRFVRRGRGDDAETARGVLNDITITESGSQEAYTYALETGGGAYAAVDVTGTVPRATALTVEQTTGPVSIDGVRGALTVTHEHGSVTIREAAASVDVEVRTGDVTVAADTLPPDATIVLRTVNGDLTVRLPPAASAQLSAETDVGTIRTQGLALAEQHFTPRNAGGQYRAQLGPGEASVDLQTKNGSILIAAADTTQAASAPADTTAAPAPPTDTATPPPARSVSPADTTVRPAVPAETTVVPETGPAPDTATPDTMR